MKPEQIRKLKKGTPIKVVYRKFPYVVKYMDWECDENPPTHNNTYVYFQAIDLCEIVKARYVHAIEQVTEFK